MLKTAPKKPTPRSVYTNNVVRLPETKMAPVKTDAAKAPKPATRANAALRPILMSEELFTDAALRKHAYYADDSTLILNMDINKGLELLARHNVIVNCVVTSPPFYGQRDYEVTGQMGLEEHPSEFVAKLAERLDLCKDVLADNAFG